MCHTLREEVPRNGHCSGLLQYVAPARSLVPCLLAFPHYGVVLFDDVTETGHAAVADLDCVFVADLIGALITLESTSWRVLKSNDRSSSQHFQWTAGLTVYCAVFVFFSLTHKGIGDQQSTDFGRRWSRWSRGKVKDAYSRRKATKQAAEFEGKQTEQEAEEKWGIEAAEKYTERKRQANSEKRKGQNNTSRPHTRMKN